MAKHQLNKWVLGLLSAAASFAGCSEEAVMEEITDKGQTGKTDASCVYIRFKMNLNESGIPGTTRAREEYDTPTHEHINTIDLLVQDEESGKLIDIVTLSSEQIGNIDAGITVPLNAEKGRHIEIYAAANMTESMRQKFTLRQNCSEVSVSSAANDYWDVISEFVQGSYLPMTGQFKTDAGSEQIEITDQYDSPDNALTVTADLTRTVAKIHVLAQANEFTLNNGDKVMYVNAEDKTANEHLTLDNGDTDKYINWMGWIRLDNVRYIPNGTNKSSYIFPQTNDKAGAAYGWKDLNMDLEKYLSGRDLNIGFDAPTWSKDYTFYNELSLHMENISANHHFQNVERYEASKYTNTINRTGQDRYDKGMYCLENYFDTPSSDIEESFRSYEAVIPMVTHVTIAAKLIPRWIVVKKTYMADMDRFVEVYKSSQKEQLLKDRGLTEEDFTEQDVARWENEIRGRYEKDFTSTSNIYSEDFRIIKTLNEADARDFLNWSLKVNGLWSRNADDFENGKYSDDTFYVYDKKYDNRSNLLDEIGWTQGYLYLTAGAVATAKDDNINIKTYSVPHLGGWGYYFTYLDQLKETANGQTPYSASQVTRNTYYLVSVSNFGMPGGSIYHPEYIKVDTEPIGWTYDGKGKINLH